MVLKDGSKETRGRKPTKANKQDVLLDDIPHCPEWLSVEKGEQAVDYWNEVTSILVRAGTLQATDLQMLALHVFTHIEFIAAEKMCREQGEYIPAKIGMSHAPWSRKKLSLLSQLQAQLKQFGLSPVSRRSGLGLPVQQERKTSDDAFEDQLPAKDDFAPPEEFDE